MPKFKTTEKFIEQSIKIHGNKYDYSKVKYISNLKEVCIICSKHGEFMQKPNCHLLNHGCPKCAVERRTKTPDEIISDFTLAHGKKYDYSKVVYKDDSTRVCIICSKHGEFWQEPGVHKKGSGCPECYESRRTKTQDDFIKEAKVIHGDKYDYSKVKYIGHRNRVCIICPKHGEFWQSPGCHVTRRCNCPKCSMEGKTRTTAEFIKEARDVHGNKYDYSKVDYVRRSDKVCIICPKHGEFLQTPANHLRGNKCFKCAKIVLKDGEVCDSQAEAYMYLKYKREGFKFSHNKRYGKGLGNMRYDFYFPDLNLYEEITSYDLRSADVSGLEMKIRDFYLEKIERKRNFVEKRGGTFKFTELRLTRRQQVCVFVNAIT